MPLTFENSKVRWKYKGEWHEYYVDYNIFNASFEKKYIYIRSEYKKDIESVIYTYLTFEGLLILSSYRGSDTIKILNENNEEIQIIIPNKIDIRTNGHDIFSIEEDISNSNKVVQYSIHGKKLKEYFAPDEYRIGVFFNSPDSEKEIKVLCHGPEDKYGKDTYCLSLNLETGEWKVLYSMLDK